MCLCTQNLATLNASLSHPAHLLTVIGTGERDGAIGPHHVVEDGAELEAGGGDERRGVDQHAGSVRAEPTVLACALVVEELKEGRSWWQCSSNKC